MTNFHSWLTTFIEEKGLDLSELVEAQDGKRTQCGNVIQAMCGASPAEQAGIKTTLVTIDFKNGDPMHFVRHLAKAQTARAWEDMTNEAFGLN